MPIHRPFESPSDNPEANLSRPDASLFRQRDGPNPPPAVPKGSDATGWRPGMTQAPPRPDAPHLPPTAPERGRALRDPHPRSRAGKAGKRRVRTDLRARLIVPLPGSRVRLTRPLPSAARPCRVRAPATPRSCPGRLRSSHAPTNYLCLIGRGSINSHLRVLGALLLAKILPLKAEWAVPAPSWRWLPAAPSVAEPFVLRNGQDEKVFLRKDVS